ncbi:hypothetical protein KRMM14A1259_06870 [Krasilnikovia sp. MM14-A1259]
MLTAPIGAAAGPHQPSAVTPLTGAPVGTEYDFVDNRPGSVAPSAAQRSGLAADAVVTRWNRLGTPASLTPAPRRTLAAGAPADPETVARRYLKGSQALFAQRAADVDTMQTLARTPVGTGTVVLLRQRYGGLPAAHDGLVAVAVKGGDVLRVTSSLSPRTDRPAPATLSPAAALTKALADARIDRADLAQQRVRPVAVPMPGAAPRAAYEVVVMSRSTEHPLGYTTYVDARTGEVLIRENLVTFDADNPHWKVFPATPAGTTDTRQTWCARPAPECARAALDPATGRDWDIDPATGASSATTAGNSAESVRYWGNGTPQIPAAARPDRDYTYPFTNQWNGTRCDPASLSSPDQADVDAATANLFAMHNRMHDWAYHLGFTEATWNLQKSNAGPYGKGGDPEHGNAQQGAGTQSIRNNANQATPPDGMLPVTNMYMWQPFAGAAYPPCVDGDFDMTVIGHEYTHAISNRMIAGPDTSISSTQGGAMGESWSDLMAMEYLYESGYTPRGNTPFVTGAYVTGDNVTGIRNYDMSNSPLNYSDYGYDRGPGVHPDGEIWSATNVDIRRALLARYGAGSRALQETCANGATPVTECPGNRRWVQLVFDSFLLQATGQVSMLDMRDNMITADALRFGGANADLLWNAFAARGFGAGAASGPSDVDPVPSFASPYSDDIEATFKPLGDATGKPVRLYIGDYEAGAVPVADTDPATSVPDTVTLAPGTYRFYAVGRGFGGKRWTQTLYPGGSPVIGVVLPTNLASAAAGATVTGDGFSPGALADDAEATVWSATGGAAGRQVTVDLAGDTARLVSRVQLSTFGGGFSGLRQFEVLACDATRGQDCTTDAGYRSIFTSAADAFPAGAYRPKVSQQILRSFTVRPTPATHVRLRTLQNQCTGNPLYAGEQDNDPRAATDCATASSAAGSVNAAEFQVFSS